MFAKLQNAQVLHLHMLEDSKIAIGFGNGPVTKRYQVEKSRFLPHLLSVTQTVDRVSEIRILITRTPNKL